MAELVKTTKAKALAAAVGTLCTVIVAVFADDVLDTDEVVSLIGGLVTLGLTVYAVWRVPNNPV